MPPVKSLSQRTADELYNLIAHEKEFLPGDKLPNEHELSMRLGVSRATLREGIRVLVAQGVLDVQRGRGTFINEGAIMAGELESLESVRVRLADLFEMRLIFEPYCASRACERATKAELQKIIEQGHCVIELVENNGEWSEADEIFHKLIAKASHNEFMIRLLPIINSAVHDTMMIANNADLLAEMVVNDNKMLIEFFKNRDAKGANCAMNVHIRHVINALGLSENNPL